MGGFQPPMFMCEISLFKQCLLNLIKILSVYDISLSLGFAGFVEMVSLEKNISFLVSALFTVSQHVLFNKRRCYMAVVLIYLANEENSPGNISIETLIRK